MLPVVQQHAASLPALLMAPMRYSQYYLWATVVAFLMSNLLEEVKNLSTLMAFLVLSYGGFYFGYRIAIGSYNSYYQPQYLPSFGNTRTQQWLIVAGSIYFLIWGFNQFAEFGASGLGGVLERILSPGAAYDAKFDVYQAQVDNAYVSPLVQLLTIVSIIYGMFLPLAISSWTSLTNLMRLLVVVATSIYVMGYLFIGTMKGLGDVTLFIVCGAAVIVGKRSLMGRGADIGRKVRRLLVGLGVLLFAYMAVNQLQRAEQFGITESAIVGDVSDTVIARTLGPKAAYGFYQVLAYPSHGYLGLSYSMSVPFEFSGGAGFSQAFESYRYQYLGGEDNTYLTYPYRSERTTGWPAGMYWSTIFPWLASDLTFYLIPVFMTIVGAVFARVWVSCLYGTSVLALTALGQFFIFVAFIPANNQVLMLRPGLWIVISLLGIAMLQLLVKPRQT
jgi:hypothetical protein